MLSESLNDVKRFVMVPTQLETVRICDLIMVSPCVENSVLHANLEYPPRIILVIGDATIALPPLHHDRRLETRI